MLEYINKYQKEINLFAFSFLFILISSIILKNPIQIGGSDFWMHAGHVELFSQNISNPVSTHDEAAEMRIRNFSPWQLLLASIKNIFSLDTLTVMSIGGVICVFLIFLGVWKTAYLIASGPLSQTSFLISILFVIGTGYFWSEEIHIESIFTTASYPSSIAVALSFFNWYFLNDYLHTQKNKSALIFIAFTALILLIHPMVFLHIMVFLALWTLFYHQQQKHLYITFILVLIAVLVSTTWPYFNPVKVSLAAISGAETRWDNVFTSSEIKLTAEDTGRSKFYGLGNFFIHLGIATLSYILIFVFRNKNNWFLASFLLICTFMWIFGKDLHVPTANYRWAMPTIFALQLIYAGALSKAINNLIYPNETKVGLKIISVVFLIVTISNILWHARTVYWNYSPLFSNSITNAYSSTNELKMLIKKLKIEYKNKTIIADHQTSYSLLGLGLKPVIFSRKSNIINDKLIKIFSSETRSSERLDLIKPLSSPIIIIDLNKSSKLLEELKEHTIKINQSGRYLALKIK